jgi:hypothetical protein
MSAAGRLQCCAALSLAASVQLLIRSLGSKMSSAASQSRQSHCRTCASQLGFRRLLFEVCWLKAWVIASYCGGLKIMKALEVLLDGEVLGTFVPPKGGSFVASVGNIPRRYMRAHIRAGTLKERWQWQLPDIQEGQLIAFRMVEAKSGTGVTPHRVRKVDRAESEEFEKMFPVLMSRAAEQLAAEKNTTLKARIKKRSTKKP